MNISQIKRKILEILWATGKPMRVQDIAEKTGLNISSSMMHLLWLRKAGYVSTPEKSYYAIAKTGKEAIGLPKLTKEKALHILRELPKEEAFHFYTGIDQYVGVYANSLNDFCDKIQTVNMKSIEFHAPRRDFELWLDSLGDLELAKIMGIIRRASLSGENLRKKVYESVKSRCEELTGLSSEAH
ncbi:ArsR family transcriptional regulator [Candidatus Bathyarchaeota archaeon]|nr:MAG: ArsR family transcriptional regulator [Candidatus Bathyarchaeota archaeon]